MYILFTVSHFYKNRKVRASTLPKSFVSVRFMIANASSLSKSLMSVITMTSNASL